MDKVIWHKKTITKPLTYLSKAVLSIIISSQIILGMQEEVKKEFEILSAITGSRKEMPVVVIWTDKTLADLQANHWKKIISRYS